MSEFFTYTIYRDGPKVGITFKPTPSLSYSDLNQLIIDLRHVRDDLYDHMEDGS